MIANSCKKSTLQKDITEKTYPLLVFVLLLLKVLVGAALGVPCSRVTSSMVAANLVVVDVHVFS